MPCASWAKIGRSAESSRDIRMRINSILDHFANTILRVAAIAVRFAIVELTAQFRGRRLTDGLYSCARIIELTAVRLVLAIVNRIRQIRIALQYYNGQLCRYDGFPPLKTSEPVLKTLME